MVVGLGLGGSIYFYDQCIAEVIDDDEIQCGTRRAGGYYGVISFFIRLAGVINFLIIGLVFAGAEWAEYTPNPGVNVQLGLQFLMGIYPAIVLMIGVIGLYFYPIKGQKLLDNQKRLKELHDKKMKDA
jgi:Na+/melibiose symporter-like transporter